MDCRRRTLCLAAVLAPLIVAIADAAASTDARLPAPTILATARGTMEAVAYDNGWLVYADSTEEDDCMTLWLRSPRGTRQQLGNACPLNYEFFLGLGGRRAAWGYFDAGGNHGYGAVVTASAGSRPVVVEGLTLDYREVGPHLVGIAGDGGTLVYATTTVSASNEEVCYPDFQPPPAETCTFRVSGGTIAAISATGELLPMPRSPPAAAIAVSGMRVAVVLADTGRSPSFLVPHGRREGAVEVRDVATGRVHVRLAAGRPVKEIALSSKVVAVRGYDGIRYYSADGGQQLGSVSLRGGRTLAVSGPTVVYSTRTSIWMLDTRTGSRASIVATPRPASGLWIEGRRVVWSDGSEVRAVTLPR